MCRAQRKQVFRRILVLAATFTAICLLWNAINRLSMARNVSTYELPTSNPVIHSNGSFTLATFNIAHGRGTNTFNVSRAKNRHARLDQIAALLSFEDIDIAVLQEVDFDATWSGRENQAAYIASKAGFRYVLEQSNFDIAIPFIRLRWGNAVLSKFKITGGRSVKLPVYSAFEDYIAGSKQAAIADIVLFDELTIKVMAVHMEPRDEDTRVRCAYEIISAGTNSTMAFFCIGDFNSAPSNFPGAKSDARGLTLIDTLLKSGLFKTEPKSVSSTNQLTWPSYAPKEVDDWILVPSSWKILEYRVIHTDLSDHRCVVMDVQSPIK